MQSCESEGVYNGARGQISQALSWLAELQGETAVALQVAMERLCEAGGAEALPEIVKHAAKLRTNSAVVADILADAQIALDKVRAHEFQRQATTASEHFDQLQKVTGELVSLEAKLARRVTHAITDPALRVRVYEAAEGRCFYCTVEVTIERDPACPERHFHIDHIVARSVGGIDHFNNYVASCQRCNCEKGDRSFAEFVRQKRKPILRVVGE